MLKQIVNILFMVPHKCILFLNIINVECYSQYMYTLQKIRKNVLFKKKCKKSKALWANNFIIFLIPIY